MIAPLAYEHAADVARLHREALPADFLSMLGPRFLRAAFYRELLDPAIGFGYGWFEEARLVGFVSGVYEGTRFTRRATRGHPLVLASALVARPALLYRALRIARYTTVSTDEPGMAQIRANGVEAGHRGRGIGRRLYETALRHLSARGHASCTVMVAAHDAAVNRLWASFGGAVERSVELNGEARHVYRVPLKGIEDRCSATSAR